MNPLFLDKKFADEYDRTLIKRNYPFPFLPEIMRELESEDRILDVGSGSGLFAIPLHRQGWKVTALEPSEAMNSRLLEKDGSLHPLHMTWSDYIDNMPSLEKIYDVLLFMHSIYVFRNWQSVVEQAAKITKKKILVLVRESSIASFDLLAELRRTLSENYRTKVSSKDLEKWLQHQNINFRKKSFSSKFIFSGEEMEDEIHRIIDKMESEGSDKSEVIGFIRNWVEDRGQGRNLPVQYNDSLFTIFA